jgi:F0F1-type ATP synthase epsilon subunit
MEEASKEEMPGKKGQITITPRHTTLGRTPLDE